MNKKYYASELVPFILVSCDQSTVLKQLADSTMRMFSRDRADISNRLFAILFRLHFMEKLGYSLTTWQAAICKKASYKLRRHTKLSHAAVAEEVGLLGYGLQAALKQ